MAQTSARTILAFGATGQQGSALVKSLVKLGGFEVHAVTRDVNSDKAKALASLPNVKVVEGEVGNHAHLFKSKSIYGVFFFHIGFDIEESVKQTKEMLDLAVQSGVKHIVFTTADLCGYREKGTGIPFLDCKIPIENHLLKLGASSSGAVKTTILRPTGFYENFYRPGYKDQVTTTWHADKHYQLIGADDIGRIAAEAFAHPDRWGDKAFSITGDSLTPPEIVANWKEVTGQPLSATEPPQFPPFMIPAMTFFADNEFQADLAWNREQFPWLTDLKTWLASSTFAEKA